jgi:hypothetical protein
VSSEVTRERDSNSMEVLIEVTDVTGQVTCVHRSLGASDIGGWRTKSLVSQVAKSQVVKSFWEKSTS